MSIYVIATVIKDHRKFVTKLYDHKQTTNDFYLHIISPYLLYDLTLICMFHIASRLL